MIPLKDINRAFTTPHINRLLLIMNVIVFMVFWLSFENIILSSSFAVEMEQSFVMYPYNIVRGRQLYTLITSMFMHDPSGFLAGLFHLLGNMLYLYVFGDNVEDVFGHAGYLVFYIFCGLMASLAYIFTLRGAGPAEGVVGASGAISGVLGAYLVLYPKARILTLVFPIIVPIPAIIFLGFWFVTQWLYVFFDIGSNIAWWAHIGGFVAGMFLAVAFGLKRKEERERRFRF